MMVDPYNYRNEEPSAWLARIRPSLLPPLSPHRLGLYTVTTFRLSDSL